MACFLYLLMCVLSSAPNSDSSDSHTTPAFVGDPTVRTWTDATGTRHAQATLTRIDGDQLWLTTPDGRRSTTTVGQLSERDRQYVAILRSKAEAARSADSKTVTSKLVDTVVSGVPMTSWFHKSESDHPAGVVPAALVYVRVSRGFLEEYVERSVQRRKPVRDCVLGTRLIGESETIGKTKLLLCPSRDKLSGEIAFSGTVTSQTTGYNGPAILQILSDATFQARKPISFGDDGLHISPATAEAPTNLHTTNIESTLPGLRGRIVTRIAWRRDDRSRDEAEAITSEHAAHTIREDLDQSIDNSVARVKQALKWDAGGLEIDSTQLTIRRFRTTADYVEMAMMRQDATMEERSLRPPEVAGDPDIAVRVNRSIIRHAMADAELMTQLSPLLAKLLDARFIDKAMAMVRSEMTAPDNTTKWAIDPHWIALDFTKAAR